MAITRLNNNSISAVSALPSGVGGKVLQHQYASFSIGNTSITSTSNVATVILDKITPSSSSSKIIIQAQCPMFVQATGSGGNDWFARGTMAIYRDTTNIGEVYGGGGSGKMTGAYNYAHSTDLATMSIEDAPSSTNEITYTVYLRYQRLQGSGGEVNPQGLGTISLMEIA